MFGFFKGSNNKPSTPKKQTPPTAEYEPPFSKKDNETSGGQVSSVAHFNNGSHSNIHGSNNSNEQNEESLFGGMSVHSHSYGNTSTYSTTSSDSKKSSTSIGSSSQSHETSKFPFINNDETTEESNNFSSSATTPVADEDDFSQLPTQIKINTANKQKPSRRRKEPSNNIAKNNPSKKVDDDLKELEESRKEMENNHSNAKKPVVEKFTPSVIATPLATTRETVTNSVHNEDDDSTISTFLPKNQSSSSATNGNSSVTTPVSTNTVSDDLDFTTVQVKPRNRHLDRTNSTEIHSPSLNGSSSPSASKSSSTSHEEPPLKNSRDQQSSSPSLKIQENIREDDEKDVVDGDWLNIKSTVNSSLTKFSSKISSIFEEERKKVQEKKENQFSILQQRIQSLEQQLDKLTELEDFEAADKIEQELSVLRNKVEDIQIKEKNNDGYIGNIGKILGDMKREISIVYSRVDFSFSTSKKDYDDFVKKNNPLRDLRRERLESETNRIKRMGESINLEEKEFQKRKSRIIEQIESSTRDMRIQQDVLTEQNNVIAKEIEELERKLREKRSQQKSILAQLDEVTDKIKKYEEEFNDQLKLISNDEHQFQKRKQNYLEDVEAFEKLSESLNKDLALIETKETKKYQRMMDKRQYKDYLQTQQVRIGQIIEIIEGIETLEDFSASNDDRSLLIKELGALTQQISALKSNLASITLELDNSTQQLQRANDRLPKLQADKLEYAKNRKFKEAAQCKEESDKLTKLIQELETNIPNLKKEQQQIEEERDMLIQKLEASHKKLEQFDAIDSKRVIRACLKRINFLESSKSKLLDVETPDQLRLRFDVIDELLSLLNYQVEQLRVIIGLSDSEFEQIQQLALNPALEAAEEERMAMAIQDIASGLTDEEKLANARETLRMLQETENKLNDDLSVAAEKEEFDMCELLDRQIEETRTKIIAINLEISTLEQKVAQNTPQEPSLETSQAQQPEEETSSVQESHENEGASSFDFLNKDETAHQSNIEQAVGDEEAAYHALNEETKQSSFDFLNKEDNVASSENEQTSNTFHEEQPQKEEKSSFDFMEEDDQDMSQNEEYDASQEYQSVAEDGDGEKSSFDFIQ
ncbi:hypothetical protein FDP41_012614 [Naegleria fowleri]|uniref:UVR domain-containing protein n=1 Tax=Naegleria fowleri TaxID=5763 RepID=A0A6A5C4G5_NAEFO|nr:uncharacterized protein FDP41_012614 [Naegleria fowleri]KAF0981354.1 hypothetical protein FDP41_012614 [Naegleria fowleri]